MACEEGNSLLYWLKSFQGSDVAGAGTCPYVSDLGGGIPMSVFALFVFGMVGLALSVKAQHPGPVVVSLILSAAVVARSVPGIATRLVAIVILFILVGGSLYLYQRSQSAL